jgi:hypothetical protein
MRPLERKLALQCSPWARLAGAGEPIPASSPVLAAGEGLGMVRALGVDLHRI